MHEASLVVDLIERVDAIAAGARVTKVHLRVGDMAGVNDEALMFAFEALRGDVLGNHAELVIESTLGSDLDLVAIEVDNEGTYAADDSDRRETAGQERGFS